MSALLCSISGFPLIEGVVSKKTGHLYQKSTILTHIRAYGTCPHTGQNLKQADLIQLKGGNNSFATQNRSISEMIQKLSNQYDSLILDAHLSKQELQKTRQELAVSLYQQDASIRVISKMKEQLLGKKQELASVVQQISIEHNKISAD